MRLLLARLTGVAGMLILAGAIAEGAPISHTLAAQTAPRSASSIGPVVPDPLPRRRSSPAPPPTPAPTAAVRPVSAPAPPPAPVAPRPVVRTTIGTGQWGLINQDRAANGLAPLHWSACLAAIAAQNAARMAAQGYISHANGVYLDLGCHLGSHAGENVGYISNGINDAWMNSMFMASPEHRANILGPYHYVGVAWVVAPTGAAYIAVEFS